MFFPSNKVEAILNSDDLAISNENEVILLIKKWNSQEDKSNEEVDRLMSCCR